MTGYQAGVGTLCGMLAFFIFMFAVVSVDMETSKDIKIACIEAGKEVINGDCITQSR